MKAATIFQALAAASFALGVGLSSRWAAAHPQYPAVVQSELGLSQAPTCLLCHTTVLGQKGTATQPFADTLKGYGLPSSLDPGALSAALERAGACATDSDGDGEADVGELLASTDPNDGPGPPTSSGCEQAAYDGPLPETGCALVAPRPSNPALAWPLVVGVALCLARTARRRRAQG